MANTTNLSLVKPAGTDHALISDINGNMDIIDAAIGALPSGSNLQGEINSLNDSITQLNNRSDACALTNYTNILTYNSDNNLFTFPADGYVYLSVTEGNNGRGVIYGAGANNSYIQIGNAQGRFSMFVKKGMKTYIAGTADIYRFIAM